MPTATHTLRTMDLDTLDALSCTRGLDCEYHGVFNRELQRRSDEIQ